MIKDVNVVAIECMRELEIIGIPYSNKIKKFSVNYHTRRYYGKTILKPDRTYEIEIASFVMLEEVPLETLKNTLIHELLHTCEGCMNHGKTWKEYAARVKKIYGYNIQSLPGDDDIPEEVEKRINSNAKYKYQCCECGKMIYMNRKCRFTEHSDWFTHRNCGGRFKKVS